MADPSETHDTVMEKIGDKIHDHHDSSSSSSSSDSENDKPASPSAVKAKVYRLFGRERPVHKALGGGKHADILLWRNKKVSASVLGVATGIWVVFELIEYHLLTLICHILMLLLTGMFLWSNANSFINKSTPRIPEIHLPEEQLLQIASALTQEINRAFAIIKYVASGKDLKKFLKVIVCLWVLSIMGSCFNFLTLFYINFVLLYTLPAFYEKYEDKVDPLAEKAAIEFKKQYAVFDAKVLSKIPTGPLKTKKV